MATENVNRVIRNITKLVGAGAKEVDISEYLNTEKITPQQLGAKDRTELDLQISESVKQTEFQQGLTSSVSPGLEGALPGVIGAIAGTGATAAALSNPATAAFAPQIGLLAESTGGLAGEGINQFFGVTEPSNPQLVAAFTLPGLFRGAGAFIKALAKRLPGAKRTLQEIAIERVAGRSARQELESIPLPRDFLPGKKSVIGSIVKEPSKPLFKQLDTLDPLVRLPKTASAIRSLKSEMDKLVPALKDDSIVNLLDDLDDAISGFQPAKVGRTSNARRSGRALFGAENIQQDLTVRNVGARTRGLSADLQSTASVAPKPGRQSVVGRQVKSQQIRPDLSLRTTSNAPEPSFKFQNIRANLVELKDKLGTDKNLNRRINSIVGGFNEDLASASVKSGGEAGKLLKRANRAFSQESFQEEVVKTASKHIKPAVGLDTPMTINLKAMINEINQGSAFKISRKAAKNEIKDVIKTLQLINRRTPKNLAELSDFKRAILAGSAAQLVGGNPVLSGTAMAISVIAPDIIASAISTDAGRTFLKALLAENQLTTRTLIAALQSGRNTEVGKAFIEEITPIITDFISRTQANVSDPEVAPLLDPIPQSFTPETTISQEN